MLRSLYSGVSGMKGFQTQMDVIANNVSNVNTHGFKAGRVLFQDMVSQNTTSASAPGLGLGGVNGKQVGLGMQTGAVDTMTGRGNGIYRSGHGPLHSRRRLLRRAQGSNGRF